MWHDVCAESAQAKDQEGPGASASIKVGALSDKMGRNE